MRVPVVFIVLAISGVSGLATASVSILDAPELAPELPALATSHSPVLYIEPAKLAMLPADAPIPTVQLRTSVARDIMRSVERVDKLPTHMLLSDGSLVATYDGADDGVLMRGVLAPDLTMGVPTSSGSPTPLGGGPRDGTNQGDAGASRATPSATFSPDPTVTQDVRTFDPRPATLGSSGGVIVASGIAFAALAGLGVLLYHRIRPNAALENQTRKVIFEAVSSTPGLGVHEISRLAGVSYSTATYHLERLIGAGMIVMTPDGNKLCYYKNGGAFSESERKILPLLKNEEAAKLFEAILDAPGTYRAALAEQLGVTATTINWHLRRLREAGLVDETRLGRSAHLYARTDALRPTFSALASKVETSEPIVAERLRKYAGDTSSSAVGAA